MLNFTRDVQIKKIKMFFVETDFSIVLQVPGIDLIMSTMEFQEQHYST